jgi:hypothetical protein
MNDMLTQQFENRHDITETMSIMNNYIVPCLPCILQSGFTDDTCAVEEIREKWCSFLGQEIDGMFLNIHVNSFIEQKSIPFNMFRSKCIMNKRDFKISLF